MVFGFRVWSYYIISKHYTVDCKIYKKTFLGNIGPIRRSRGFKLLTINIFFATFMTLKTNILLKVTVVTLLSHLQNHLLINLVLICVFVLKSVVLEILLLKNVDKQSRNRKSHLRDIFLSWNAKARNNITIWVFTIILYWEVLGQTYNTHATWTRWKQSMNEKGQTQKAFWSRNSKTHYICNLHTWVFMENYRSI